MAPQQRQNGYKKWAKYNYNRCLSAKCRGWNWAEDTSCYYCRAPLAVTVPPIGNPVIPEWPQSRGGRAGQKEQHHFAGGSSPNESEGETNIKFFEAQLATYRNQGMADDDILVTTISERLETAKQRLHTSKDPYKRAESGLSKLQAKQRARSKQQAALEELEEKQRHIAESIVEAQRSIGLLDNEIATIQAQVHRDRLEAEIQEGGTAASLKSFFGDDFQDLANKEDLQAKFNEIMATTKLAIQQQKAEANKKEKQEQEELQKKEQEDKKKEQESRGPQPPQQGQGDDDEPMLSSEEMQKIILKRLSEATADINKDDLAKQLADDFEADSKRRRTRK